MMMIYLFLVDFGRGGGQSRRRPTHYPKDIVCSAQMCVTNTGAFSVLSPSKTDGTVTRHDPGKTMTGGFTCTPSQEG